MSPIVILIFILIYFGILVGISYITGKNADNSDFFIGNRKSHWYLIALGMIGDSLSGVTFISVPGTIETQQFSYMQVVLGYFVGYIIIAQVLLPLYYKLQLTSIYSYLLQRFGHLSQKTGSFFFLISRLLGAAGRLFLAVSTIQIFVFNQLGIPFVFTVFIMILLMLVYTFQGGIKTLVWTDSFQSILLLFGLIAAIVAIISQLNLPIGELWTKVQDGGYTKTFFWDTNSKNYFWKQFLGGMFIAATMTGLDQNMMQKNLSCPSLKDAQKNIYSFSFIVVFVNLLFLFMGALLFVYAHEKGIALPQKSDEVFPLLALNYLGAAAGLAFIIGLTAATFSSADSVLTTLTTSFCIDFLNYESRTDWNEKKKTIWRKRIHIGFSFLLFIVIIAFQKFNSGAIINTVLSIANYTYGPLLGLFAFGLMTKIKTRDAVVPFICVIAPLFCLTLNNYSKVWFNGYEFGYELLIINGMITFMGLFLFRKKEAL